MFTEQNERGFTMNKDEMLNGYTAHTAASAYIIGFVLNGLLYSIFTRTLQDVYDNIKLDRASTSHGGMAKIRIRMDKISKLKLARVATCHGVASVLNYADMKNAGEKFERYITEQNGKVWVKDSVPFWQAGDIEINGEQVQIKFDGAEITNEKTLAKVLG